MRKKITNKNRRTEQYKKLSNEGKIDKLNWKELLKEIIKKKKTRENSILYKNKIESAMRRHSKEREAEFEGNIISVAYKDGYLAVGGSSTNIQIAQILKDDIRYLHSLEGHTDMVSCLEFGGSYHHLFSGGADNRMIYWQNFKIFQVFQDFSTTIRSLSWNSKNKILACGSQQDEILIYEKDDSNTQKLDIIQRLKANTECLTLEICHNGNFLASGGYNSESYNSLVISTFNNTIKQFGEIQRIKSPLNKVITCLNFSTDGEVLITGTRHYSCYVWKYQRNKGIFEQVQALTNHSDYLKSVSISSRGRWIITASDDRTLKKYRLNETGKYEIERSYSGFKNELWGSLITRDQKYIIASSMQPEVKIYPLEDFDENETKKSEKNFLGEMDNKAILNLKISKDGNMLISNNIHGVFKIYFRDESGFFELSDTIRKKEMSERPLFPVDISYDNTMFITSVKGKVVVYSRLFFTPKKKIKEKFSIFDNLTASDAEILTLIFFNKCYAFATGAKDKKIKIWIFEKKSKKFNLGQVLQTSKDWIVSLYMLENDKILVAGCFNKQTQIFEKKGKKFKIFQSIESQQSRTRVILMLREGKILILASDDKTLRIYFKTKKNGIYAEIQEFKNVHDETTFLLKSKNGKFLLSKGLKKGTIRVWGISESGIVPLTQINSALKIAVDPEFKTLFQVKQKNPSLIQFQDLKQEPELEEDFKLFKIMRNLFKSQKYGYNQFMVKEAFEFLFRHLRTKLKGTVDSRLEDKFLIHCKINVLVLCIVSGFSEVFRIALKEFGYNPFFYRNREFDPLHVAIYLDNTACLDIFADYFKSRKKIFELVINEKFFFNCMKTSSKNLKSFVISAFFNSTKSYKMEIHNEFPIGKKNYEYFEGNSKIVENSLHQRFQKKSSKNRKKGRLPETINFFVTSVPTDLSLTGNSTFYTLQAFSYFSQDQKMGKFRYYIKEIWSKNLGKIIFISLLKLINFSFFTIFFIWNTNLKKDLEPSNFTILKWSTFGLSTLMLILNFLVMIKGRKYISNFINLLNFLLHLLGPLMILLSIHTDIEGELVSGLTTFCMLAYGIESFSIFVIFQKFRTIFGIFIEVFIESIWLLTIAGVMLCLFALLNLNVDLEKNQVMREADYSDKINFMFEKIFNNISNMMNLNDYNKVQHIFHVLTVIVLVILTPAYIFATVISVYNKYHMEEEIKDLAFVHSFLQKNSFLFSIFRNARYCRNRSRRRKNFKHFLEKKDIGDVFRWSVVKKLREDMDNVARKAHQIEEQGGRMKASLNKLTMGSGGYDRAGYGGSRRTSSNNEAARMIGGKSLDGVDFGVDVF